MKKKVGELSLINEVFNYRQGKGKTTLNRNEKSEPKNIKKKKTDVCPSGCCLL